jgi:hypothetical protein
MKRLRKLRKAYAKEYHHLLNNGLDPKRQEELISKILSIDYDIEREKISGSTKDP